MSEDRGKNHPIPHETIREIRNGSIRNPTLALKNCVKNLRLPDFLDWQVRQAVAASH